MKHRRGFTLIETLIVIAILGLTATLALTASSAFHGQRLEAAARVLTSDLRLARSQAIRFNTSWSASFDIADNRYELLHAGGGDPPPLVNPLAPNSRRYQVDVGKIGVDGDSGNGVELAAVVLAQTHDAVTEVTFGPQGGTGPARNEDTVILLIEGTGANMRVMRVTVSWLTGQVWLEGPDTPAALFPART